MAQQIDPSFYANLPTGAPPPSLIPNFDHPESRAVDAHVGIGGCIGITLVFVVLRLYVKMASTQLLGWDDCKSAGVFRNAFNAKRSSCMHTGIRTSFAQLPFSVALIVWIPGPHRSARRRFYQ
jgi:hypothetical protein